MGVLIENVIALDWHYKNRAANDQGYVHFLSHISRNGRLLSKILPSEIEKVYTSDFNAWYLIKFYKVNEARIISIKLGAKTNINFNGFEFSFEFLDSNHCPGSVMILLNGSFGCYLYSGACRYRPDMLFHPSLTMFCDNKSLDKKLDKLYIDGHYYCENMDFPSREEVIRNALQIIDAHKDECHLIYICCHVLGMEKALATIALELCEKIYVSKEKYLILRKLGIAAHFTTNPRKSRIHTIKFKDVTLSAYKKRSHLHGPCITIVMSACNMIYRKNDIDTYRKSGIFILPYSDHNSSKETSLMKNCIRSKKVIYLNKYQSPFFDDTTSNVRNDISKANLVFDKPLSHNDVEIFDLVSQEVNPKYFNTGENNDLNKTQSKIIGCVDRNRLYLWECYKGLFHSL